MHGAGGWTGSQQHSHNTQGKSQLWAFPQGERRGKESLENPAASRLKARGENCPWMGPVQVGTAGQSWEDLPVSTATANPWLGHLCHLPGHREGAGTPRKWHSKGMAFQGNGSIDPFSSACRDPQHLEPPPSQSAREVSHGDSCTVAEAGQAFVLV